MKELWLTLSIILGVTNAVAYGSSLKDVMWSFRSPAYQMAQMLHEDAPYDPEKVLINLDIFRNAAERLAKDPQLIGSEGEDMKIRLQGLIEDIKNIGPTLQAENFKTDYRKIIKNCNSCHEKYDNDY